ncbi:MAG: hypothetical protein SGJ19_24405 [Planctomycetia bacterium]|nr:hypothetical protein [Planctomycetia bacterium]
MLAFSIPGILIWLGLGYLGGRMAARKGYAPHYGYLSALIFGPLSLIVVALVPQTEEGRFQAKLEAEIDAEADYYDRKQSCPNCRREVSADASLSRLRTSLRSATRERPKPLSD